jgi:hypothetical protein
MIHDGTTDNEWPTIAVDIQSYLCMPSGGIKSVSVLYLPFSKVVSVLNVYISLSLSFITPSLFLNSIVKVYLADCPNIYLTGYINNDDDLYN